MNRQGLAKFVGILIIALSFYVGWKGNFNVIQNIKDDFRKQVTMRERNQLGDEKSPYLLQHKDNPVHWYAWSDKAFEASRALNKPIFLSIGYATCHWCHVMEHDSFENEGIAKILNENFICIKVDREERPDIDHLYMSAVTSLSGRGGWPMSVFLTPDLKPFWGGTFFWRDQFAQILHKISSVWKSEPQQILQTSSQLADHLKESMPQVASTSWTNEDLKKAYQAYSVNFDPVHGGFGGAPKFPKSFDLSFLMRYFKRSGQAEALHMVETTLDRMSRGGMYDHLGGGFARYATDNKWMVPHFEKMLYDNAQLAITYLEAYQLTQKQVYADVARDILDYVLRDMTHAEGGYYSAEDADSEGVEGKFYVWTDEELHQLLTSDEYALFTKVYGVTKAGNFEAEAHDAHSPAKGSNILYLTNGYDWSVKKDEKLKSISKKLFDVREKRIHPLKDDKILTDWNGLMIAAMAKAYRVLGDKRYLESAQNAANFIEKNLYKKEDLLHRYRDGDARIDAMLADYASLNFGLIELYQADFNAHWIRWAVALQEQQDLYFWDKQYGGYFNSPATSKDVFLRQKEWFDGAIPSGNSLSLFNLERLFLFTADKDLKDRRDELLKVFSPYFKRYPAGFPMLLNSIDFITDNGREAVVTGFDQAGVDSFIKEINGQFLPNLIVAVSTGRGELAILDGKNPIDNKLTVYICQEGLCEAPITDMEKVKTELKTAKPIL